MESPEEQEPPPEFTDPEEADPEIQKAFANQLTTMIIFMEGLLGVGGVLLGIWYEMLWLELIQPTPTAIVVGIAGGLGLVGLHGLLLFPGKSWNPLRKYIFEPFARTFLGRMRLLSFEDIVLISIISGCAEELLFRGWFQSSYGIVAASILFGMIHIWGKQGIPYGIYAVGIGFALGGLYSYTGNLWAPILAHIINNFLGLLCNKHGWMPDVEPSSPEPNSGDL